MLRSLRRLSALIFSPAAVLKACNLTMAARPVTQPPHLAQRQPPKWAGFGALAAVMERHRSERVFRNEFPYLGRVGLAAWAGFSLAGSHRVDRHMPRSRCECPDARPGARSACGGAQGRSQGCAEGRPEGPPGAGPSPRRAGPGRARPSRPAAGRPGSIDLRALDQILSEG